MPLNVACVFITLRCMLVTRAYTLIYHLAAISSRTTHPPLLLMTSFTFSISTSACAMSLPRSYSPFLRFIFDKCQVAVQRRLCIVRSQVLGSAMLCFLLVFPIVAMTWERSTIIVCMNMIYYQGMFVGTQQGGSETELSWCMFCPIKPCSTWLEMSDRHQMRRTEGRWQSREWPESRPGGRAVSGAEISARLMG